MKRVLLVDDSPISRRMLKRCIAIIDEYEFHEAGNGLEGLSKFKEIRPHVTFMDLTMPVMGGMEAIEQIRKIDGNAIIIACTADIQIQSIRRVLEAGAFTALRKPPKEEDVRDAMAKVLSVAVI